MYSEAPILTDGPRREKGGEERAGEGGGWTGRGWWFEVLGPLRRARGGAGSTIPFGTRLVSGQEIHSSYDLCFELSATIAEPRIQDLIMHLRPRPPALSRTDAATSGINHLPLNPPPPLDAR